MNRLLRAAGAYLHPLQTGRDLIETAVVVLALGGAGAIVAFTTEPIAGASLLAAGFLAIGLVTSYRLLGEIDALSANETRALDELDRTIVGDPPASLARVFFEARNALALGAQMARVNMMITSTSIDNRDVGDVVLAPLTIHGLVDWVERTEHSLLPDFPPRPYNLYRLTALGQAVQRRLARRYEAGLLPPF